MQESSVWFGLCYIITSLAMYDEYGNDVLYMPEGSCFPRLQYRKKSPPVRTASFSKPDSFRGPSSRSVSLKTSIIELKTLELLDGLFSETKHQGELLLSEGIIIPQDLEDSKSTKNDNRVINVGLPTYCILQVLLRAIKANSEGLLLNNITEVTTMNRPKDAFFDWFFNPLLIIKDQIKAHNLTEEEENYFCKLVLLNGNSERLKNLNLGSPVVSEIKLAELDALARRLRGITRSISRYPTFKRRFDALVSSLSEELAEKYGYGSQLLPRSRSRFIKILSQRSFRGRTNNRNSDKDDSQSGTTKDIAIV
ncbi:hypothetical protein GIB67_018853 [Kingdonia uniflora]|uniref:Uncharacterized protein n=1 Tax=Kingdonia uniflora TaxID=39325 RepID=A0A7J7NDU8_9MAGN|nr:hypothetical protein GIB67_018853 [Kingdonia uniflora]